MIRFANQRTGGALGRLDLALHWPSLSGYSPDLSQAFNDTGSTSTIVFLTISERTAEFDSTMRLAQIYQPAFLDGEATAPDGLMARPLDPQKGYLDETLYFERGSTRPFVTRCYRGEDTNIPADCLREVNMASGLTLSYRFRRAHLNDWRELDATLFSLVANFTKSAAIQ